MLRREGSGDISSRSFHPPSPHTCQLHAQSLLLFCQEDWLPITPQLPPECILGFGSPLCFIYQHIFTEVSFSKCSLKSLIRWWFWPHSLFPLLLWVYSFLYSFSIILVGSPEGWEVNLLPPVCHFEPETLFVSYAEEFSILSVFVPLSKRCPQCLTSTHEVSSQRYFSKERQFLPSEECWCDIFK